jgi:hypothetical protein
MWLYVPSSTSCPSAPAAGASTSASDWRFRALEASAWWRGKPSRSRNWYQRSERVSFIRLLCGAMPEPSMADAGAAAWTASLAASRASRTAWPDASRAASTRATFGATRGASSSSPAAGSSSSKTSAACSRRGLTKSLERSGFGETFASLVSRLRSDCSRRRKSARAMSANGSSSSLWPTMRSGDGAVNQIREGVTDHKGRLEDAVSMWRTPNANNGERGGLTPAEREGHTLNLQDQVQAFPASARPTPTTRDHKGGGTALIRPDGKVRNDMLDWVAEKWPSPTVADSRASASVTAGGAETRTGYTPGVTLTDAITLWSTPRATDGEKGGPNQNFGAGGTPLPAQASQWATPQARDHMPPHSPERITAMRAEGHGMRNLNDEAAMWATPTSLSYGDSHQPGNSRSYNLNMDMARDLYSRLVHPTYQVGEVSSHPRRSLNPLFVEWLMGWPPGWTLLAWTDFACSEMELSRFRQRMRSALSSLASPQEAPPAQLALFG